MILPRTGHFPLSEGPQPGRMGESHEPALPTRPLTSEKPRDATHLQESVRIEIARASAEPTCLSTLGGA